MLATPAQRALSLPNPFDLVNIVLARHFEASGNDDAAVHEAIDNLIQAANTTSTAYRALLSAPDTIDFNAPAVRYAYVFAYVPFGITSMQAFLTDLPEDIRTNFLTTLQGIGPPTSAASASSARKLNVTCLGGGPGTDAFGVLQWLEGLEEVDRPEKVIFDVFDRCGSWGQTWRQIHKAIGGIDTFYESLDFTTTERSPAEFEALRDANIITMIKFASVLYAQKDNRTTQPFLKGLLHQAQPGTWLVIIDNGQVADFVDWVCELLYDEWELTVSKDDLQVSVSAVDWDDTPNIKRFETVQMVGDAVSKGGLLRTGSCGAQARGEEERPAGVLISSQYS
ncbi:hypothetical protein HDV00_004318 [Rhizophlyctis rosea]|nr:hypothetical protein HDV00_004318 [Rhizophlyctis rosea]